MKPGRTRVPVGRWLTFAWLSLCVSNPAALGQRQGLPPQTIPTAVPVINTGGGAGPYDAQFANLILPRFFCGSRTPSPRTRSARSSYLIRAQFRRSIWQRLQKQ